MLNFLRVLGAINLALTIYRVTTFQWEDGRRTELNQCFTNHRKLVSWSNLICLIYNTTRSFKILCGIRAFFTILLLIKKIQKPKNCYGFWFISTLAELCIKIYLIRNGGMDSPGIIQFCIELTMVAVLTTLLAQIPGKRPSLKFTALPPV